MITKHQAEKELLSTTLSYFNNYGYFPNSRRKDCIELIDTYVTGYKGFSMSFLQIGNSLKFSYYVFIRINQIEELLEKSIPKKFQNPEIDIDSRTITSSYELIQAINKLTHFQKIKTLEDLTKTLNIFISEIDGIFHSFLEKHRDLNYINQLINKDEFWETDWRKPFNLGGNFIYKRLTIAKLADPENFNRVLEKQLEIIDQGIKGENSEEFKEVKKGVEILCENLDNLSFEA